MGFKYIPVGSTSFPFILGEYFCSMGYTTCIETGTYLGYTTRALAKIFTKVYTIEASEKIYKKTHPTLAAISNIRPILGDSRKVLPAIVKQNSQQNIIFWLDAHYCCGDTHQNQSPLIDELHIINELYPDNVIILADDARYILSKFENEHYVDIGTFISVLNTKNRYISCIDDTFIAVPDKYREVIDRYAEQITTLQARARDAVAACAEVNSLQALLK